MISSSNKERLSQATYSNRPFVVITDYDDTVAQSSPDGSGTHLAPTVAHSLYAISIRNAYFCAASARRLEDLKNEFQHISNPHFIANDGCVIEVNGITIELIPKPDYRQCEIDTLLLARNYADIIVKDMGWIFGVFLSPTHPADNDVYQLLSRHKTDDLVLVRRHNGITLQPRDKPGKAAALQLLLQELNLEDPFVTYTGDGDNDIDAQRFVKDNGGLSFKVIPEPVSEVPEYVSDCIIGVNGCAEFYLKLAIEMMDAR